jgi:hypothetical protein
MEQSLSRGTSAGRRAHQAGVCKLGSLIFRTVRRTEKRWTILEYIYIIYILYIGILAHSRLLQHIPVKKTKKTDLGYHGAMRKILELYGTLINL